MARTEFKSSQVKNGCIELQDLNTTKPGKAVITKVLQGTGIELVSTGADQGTGNVTINIATYHYTQPVAITTWTILHNLNKFPTIITIDDTGSEIVGDVQFIDLNSVAITFNPPTSGQAYLS
jgi:hypothetical protein